MDGSRSRLWISQHRLSRRSSRRLREHIHKHIVEQTVALFVPQTNEKIAVVCQAHVQERIHGHNVDPSFPGSAVVGSGKKGKPGRDSEEGLLEATMARAREEEDEFLQSVPQDETMKKRQVEAYFRKKPEMLEFLMRKMVLL